MIKTTILSALIILFCRPDTSAQAPSWQWQKRGGSPWSSSAGGDDEYTVDMATDPHGNVYVLSQIYSGLSGTEVTVDGHSVTAWAYEDWMLSSFSCDGTYRWSKVVGTDYYDVPVAVKTDTLGGVYLMGFINSGYLTRYIDVDTSWGGTSYKSTLLVKYDTGGHYQWLRMPEPDTVSEAGVPTRPMDMDVDGGGNVYMLCTLAPGAYADGSYVVTGTNGEHILHYDKNGNFISGTPLDLTFTAPSIGNLYMKCDFARNRYYISGPAAYGYTMTMGGSPVYNQLYIGCFNSSGSLKWLKTDALTGFGAGGFGKLALDDEGNIYGSSTVSAADTFGDYITPCNGPFAAKVDTNGNNVWALGSITNAATFGNTITVHGNEADVTGIYPGLLKWPGYPDTLTIAFGPGGYRVFITRFDATTGSVIGLDTLGSPDGVYNQSNVATSDRFGNFYIGGDLEYSLWMNTDTIYSIGGGSDFFFAKYGSANCDSIATTSVVNQIAGDAPITIYPDPVIDEITVQGITQATNYRLCNLTGTLIQQGTLQGAPASIRLGNYMPGLYILELSDVKGKRVTFKVLKE